MFFLPLVSGCFARDSGQPDIARSGHVGACTFSHIGARLINHYPLENSLQTRPSQSISHNIIIIITGRRSVCCTKTSFFSSAPSCLCFVSQSPGSASVRSISIGTQVWKGLYLCSSRGAHFQSQPAQNLQRNMNYLLEIGVQMLIVLKVRKWLGLRDLRSLWHNDLLPSFESWTVILSSARCFSIQLQFQFVRSNFCECKS